MIIPVAFEVSKREEFENFVVGRMKEIASTPPPPDMRVTVKLFDTEARRGLGFSARVLVDPSVDDWHRLMTMFRMGFEVTGDKHDYLRALRDAINAELGENA